MRYYSYLYDSIGGIQLVPFSAGVGQKVGMRHLIRIKDLKRFSKVRLVELKQVLCKCYKTSASLVLFETKD